MQRQNDEGTSTRDPAAVLTIHFRAMALKALDQRMATKPSATPPPTSRPAPPTGEAVASSPPSLQAASGSGTTEAKVTVE